MTFLDVAELLLQLMNHLGLLLHQGVYSAIMLFESGRRISLKRLRNLCGKCSGHFVHKLQTKSNAINYYLAPYFVRVLLNY